MGVGVGVVESVCVELGVVAGVGVRLTGTLEVRVCEAVGVEAAVALEVGNAVAVTLDVGVRVGDGVNEGAKSRRTVATTSAALMIPSPLASAPGQLGTSSNSASTTQTVSCPASRASSRPLATEGTTGTQMPRLNTIARSLPHTVAPHGVLVGVRVGVGVATRTTT